MGSKLLLAVLVVAWTGSVFAESTNFPAVSTNETAITNSAKKTKSKAKKKQAKKQVDWERWKYVGP